MYFNEIDDARSFSTSTKANIQRGKLSFLSAIILIILFGCFVIRVKGSNKNHLRIKVDSHVMLHCSNTSVEGFELRVQKGSENRDEKIHIKAHHRNQSSSLYGRRDVK